PHPQMMLFFGAPQPPRALSARLPLVGGAESSVPRQLGDLAPTPSRPLAVRTPPLKGSCRKSSGAPSRERLPPSPIPVLRPPAVLPRGSPSDLGIEASCFAPLLSFVRVSH